MYVRNYDMYVMEGSLFKYFTKLKTSSKKSYSNVEKLALKLLEDDEKGAKKNEKE